MNSEKDRTYLEGLAGDATAFFPTPTFNLFRLRFWSEWLEKSVTPRIYTHSKIVRLGSQSSRTHPNSEMSLRSLHSRVLLFLSKCSFAPGCASQSLFPLQCELSCSINSLSVSRCCFRAHGKYASAWAREEAGGASGGVPPDTACMGILGRWAAAGQERGEG